MLAFRESSVTFGCEQPAVSSMKGLWSLQVTAIFNMFIVKLFIYCQGYPLQVVYISNKGHSGLQVYPFCFFFLNQVPKLFSIAVSV